MNPPVSQSDLVRFAAASEQAYAGLAENKAAIARIADGGLTPEDALLVKAVFGSVACDIMHRQVKLEYAIQEATP